VATAHDEMFVSGDRTVTLLKPSSGFAAVDFQEKFDHLMQRHKLTFTSMPLAAVGQQKSTLSGRRFGQRQDLI
jgi:hypothetical protein